MKPTLDGVEEGGYVSQTSAFPLELVASCAALFVTACAPAPAQPGRLEVQPSSPPKVHVTETPPERDPMPVIPPPIDVLDPLPANAVFAAPQSATAKLPSAALRALCGSGYRNGRCYGCPPDRPFEGQENHPVEVTKVFRGSFFPQKQAGYFVGMYGEECSGFYHSTFIVNTSAGWRRTRGWKYANLCFTADFADGARVVCVTSGPSLGTARVASYHVVGLRPGHDKELFTLVGTIDTSCREAVRGLELGLRVFDDKIWSASQPHGASILGIDVFYLLLASRRFRVCQEVRAPRGVAGRDE